MRVLRHRQSQISSDSALNGTVRDQIAILKAMHDYAPDLLKEKETWENNTVTYVLPNGKTMEDYENQSNDQKTTLVEEQPVPCDDEDDN